MESRGQSLQKVSKKSPGAAFPKVRKKSRKRSENSSKKVRKCFLGRLFRDLFRDFFRTRPRETFSRLFGDFGPETPSPRSTEAQNEWPLEGYQKGLHRERPKMISRMFQSHVSSKPWRSLPPRRLLSPIIPVILILGLNLA